LKTEEEFIKMQYQALFLKTLKHKT
jgi:hypothetical protein